MATLKYKNGSSWVNYNLLVWPVGAVYASYTNTSPANSFGGTWTAITGRFPYYNSGTTTGGSNTHTLTTDQIPSHSHDIYIRPWWSDTAGGGQGTSYSASAYLRTEYTTLTTRTTGGGAAHNNMPAYQTLYAWRRTA